MSEEELSDRMILIINGYKECLDYNCNQTEERQREIKYDIETLETMIDLYNKEKEKNKELEGENEGQLEVLKILNEEIENRISKNEIKEKIEELDRRIDYLDKELNKAYIEREKLGTETEIDMNEQYIYNMEQERSVRHTEKYAYLKLLEEE